MWDFVTASTLLTSAAKAVCCFQRSECALGCTQEPRACVRHSKIRGKREKLAGANAAVYKYERHLLLDASGNSHQV